MTQHRVLNYTASFGCPLNCHFCSWSGSHRWNNLPLDRVINDVEYLYAQFGLQSMWFSDSTLCYKKEYILGIAEGILRKDIKISWRCNGSVFDLKRFSKEDWAILERSGLDRVFIGVENVSKKIQKIMNKRFDPEICHKIFEDMRDFDVQPMVSLIVANPCETVEDLELNRSYLSQWMKINPKVRFQICFFSPYPGTPMANLVSEQGYVPPKSLKEFGESDYFNEGARYRKDRIEWYSKETSDRYLKRYDELFADANKYSTNDWNWRKKQL